MHPFSSRSKTLLASLGLTLLLSCQGGSDDPPQSSSGVTPLAVGNHLLTFAIESAAESPHPISGIALTYLVPPGMELATEAASTSDAEAPAVPLPLQSTSLRAGEDMPQTPNVGGSYLTERRELHLFAAAPCTTPWKGDFLTLTFEIKPGSILTQAELLNILSRPMQQKLVAFDASTRSSVLLDSKIMIKTTLIQ